jgi:LCP family protein required for cell wall assembly
MNKKSNYKMDGFVSKRHDQSSENNVVASNSVDHFETTRGSVNKIDITESLKMIDESGSSQTGIGNHYKHRRTQHSKKNWKKIILRSFLVVLVIILCVGGFLAYKLLYNGSKVLKGNILSVVQEQKLKEDSNGRSNFLIFGTSEDDEGGNHPGGNLTDSIMILSVDQNNKNAYMISVPRDLWVQYDSTCSVGNYGKINATYFCASNDGKDEAAGAEALESKVSSIFGVDIQYYAHVNFTAVSDIVDTLGGVDVTIESSDPRGILDRNFDWKCSYKCYYVNYKNGEVAHLDGAHALALARARNDSGGYGLPMGNFDREKNQQKIIKAIQVKALSAGTFTNLATVTSLLDTIGNNLKTNVQTSEIRTIMSLLNKIKSSSINSISLVNDSNPVVTTGTVNSQSVVEPVAGLYDYSGIQSYIAKNLSSNPVVRESAPVEVLNGTGTSGVASAEATKLKEKGYTIAGYDTAPTGTYSKVEIYEVNDGKNKTQTAAALQNIYNVKVSTSLPSSIPVGSDVDFVVILGSGFSE